LGAYCVSVIAVQLIDDVGDVFGFGTAGRGLAIAPALTGKQSALHGESWEEGGEGQDGRVVQIHFLLVVSKLEEILNH